MLGILDWGIGGLGFYARLKEARPDADVIYLSDSGSIPYGKLGRDQLRDRVAQAIRFLVARGAYRVVVACNAASTVAPLVRKDIDVEIVDIVEPAVEMVLESGIADLGIVGGRRTIRSGIYQRYFAEAGIRARGRLAQPLSAMIEVGEWRGVEFVSVLEYILHPLKDCDALLLACTHYPAAIEQFRSILPTTLILDPVDRLLRHTLSSWKIDSSSEQDRFLTTGDREGMRRAAMLAFGVEMREVERIEL